MFGGARQTRLCLEMLGLHGAPGNLKFFGASPRILGPGRPEWSIAKDDIDQPFGYIVHIYICACVCVCFGSENIWAHN